MSDLLIRPARTSSRRASKPTKAPLTCAAFLELLPFKENLLHVRWSGESTWVPLGDLAVRRSA